eukprot:5279389-Pleurochrysis_carterae.AAC.1
MAFKSTGSKLDVRSMARETLRQCSDDSRTLTLCHALRREYVVSPRLWPRSVRAHDIAIEPRRSHGLVARIQRHARAVFATAHPPRVFGLEQGQCRGEQRLLLLRAAPMRHRAHHLRQQRRLRPVEVVSP